MSQRQCIHRGAGEGVQLCLNRAPRVLSNVARARRAPREVHHACISQIHKQMRLSGLPAYQVLYYDTYPPYYARSSPSIMPGQNGRDTGHKAPYARCHLKSSVWR